MRLLQRLFRLTPEVRGFGLARGCRRAPAAFVMMWSLCRSRWTVISHLTANAPNMQWSSDIHHRHLAQQPPARSLENSSRVNRRPFSGARADVERTGTSVNHERVARSGEAATPERPMWTIR